MALIRNGSLPTQQVLVGMLSNIVILAHANDFRPPAILVVGGVVDLRDTLRWFDNKPLRPGRGDNTT